jgi:membrane protein implicated in regulation of membrane protease activity
MRRLDHRIGTFAEAHLFRYAVAAGLAAGVLAFLIGWLARREWIWFLFVMAAVVAGASSYASARWRRHERERLERRRQQPE